MGTRPCENEPPINGNSEVQLPNCTNTLFFLLLSLLDFFPLSSGTLSSQMHVSYLAKTSISRPCELAWRKMDTVKRKCMRVWGHCCWRRHADASGSYGILCKKAPEYLRKSKGCQWKRQHKRSKVVPQGCFSVYVGPERQRFVINIEFVNHPLFKTLLEDAENEYGFHNDGPIRLPCDVDFFCEALAEMESSEDHMGSSSVFHPSSHRSKQNWACELFRIPRALTLKLNHL